MVKEVSSNNSQSLLLVDDDRVILSTISSGLSKAGYVVDTAESVDEAEEWLDTHDRPDLVLLDFNMPGRPGLALVDTLKQLGQIPFILMTAHSDTAIVNQANACGAMGYLVKPVVISQIIPAIETAIKRSKELIELLKSKQDLQTALDSDRNISVAIGIVMDQYRISHTDATAMLRKTSRNKNMKLYDLATHIIQSREIMNLMNDALE